MMFDEILAASLWIVLCSWRTLHLASYTGYCGIFTFMSPQVVIKDPELIKLIGIKHSNNFMDHSNIVAPENDPVISNGLLSLEGQQWKKIRTILTPAFTASKMKGMFTLMRKCSAELSDYLSQECEGQITTTIDLKMAFTKVTNNVIASCAFGLEYNSFKEAENEFYTISNNVTDLRGIRGLSLFMASLSMTIMRIFKISFLRPHESDYFRKIFLEAIKYREENRIIRPDLIHLLLQAKEGQLRDEDTETAEERNKRDKKDLKLDVDNDTIVAQAVTFLAAGFATTSMLISFATHQLAMNSKVQDKVVEELDRVLSKTDGVVTYNSLMEMKYLDMVISETLRLFPGVPFTDRKCTSDFILDDNGKKIKIEKGIVVTFPIVALQRDEKYFPNPNEFIPERFSIENQHLVNSAVYMPFGIGPRICPGNRFALIEAKLVLAETFFKYKILPVQETENPIKIDKSSISLISENPIYLGLEKRS